MNPIKYIVIAIFATAISFTSKHCHADFFDPGFEIPSDTQFKPAYWRLFETKTGIVTLRYPEDTHCEWVSGKSTKPYLICKKSVVLSRTATDSANWGAVLPAPLKRVKVVPGVVYCFTAQYLSNQTLPVIFLSYDSAGRVIEARTETIAAGNTIDDRLELFYTISDGQWHDSPKTCHRAPAGSVTMDAAIKIDRTGIIHIENQHLNRQ